MKAPFTHRKGAVFVPPWVPSDLARFHTQFLVVQDGEDAIDVSLVPLEQLEESTIGTLKEISHLVAPYCDDRKLLDTPCVRIATSCFGEPVLYILKSHDGLRDGAIAIAGLDAAGPEGSPAQPPWLMFVADSLDSWIGRLRACDWQEYAARPGDLGELPPARQSELRMMLARLNGDPKWLKPE